MIDHCSILVPLDAGVAGHVLSTQAPAQLDGHFFCSEQPHA